MLALRGSGSPVSNNISIITEHQHVSRWELPEMLRAKCVSDPHTINMAGVIKDLLNLKNDRMTIGVRDRGLTVFECQ